MNTRPGFSDRLEALTRLGPEIKIELSRIAGIDPLNSRKIEPSDIDRMAANLRAQGQINPIVLRPDKGDGELFVLAGGRRFLALQKLQAEVGPRDRGQGEDFHRLWRRGAPDVARRE